MPLLPKNASKVIGKHMADCYYRDDDTKARVWFLDTWDIAAHVEDDGRGRRYLSLTCNSPEGASGYCPARLRLDVATLEDFAVDLLAKGRKS